MTGPARAVLAASTHVPTPTEGRIFGTLFVVVCVLAVLGYWAFEIWARRGRREQSRRPPEGGQNEEVDP